MRGEYGFISSIRIWVPNAVDKKKKERGMGRVSRDGERMNCFYEQSKKA